MLKNRFGVYVHLKATYTLVTPKRNSPGSRKTLNAAKTQYCGLRFLPKHSSPEYDSSALRRGIVVDLPAGLS